MRDKSRCVFESVSCQITYKNGEAVKPQRVSFHLESKMPMFRSKFCHGQRLEVNQLESRFVCLFVFNPELLVSHQD